jgi:hypothetical protein
MIGAWAFLLVWLCWALVNGGTALAGARGRLGVAFRNDARAIQWCLIAIVLLGGIPLLTFDLAPDASSAVSGVVTSTLFPALVVALSLTQTLLVSQANRSGTTNPPS